MNHILDKLKNPKLFIIISGVLCGLCALIAVTTGLIDQKETERLDASSVTLKSNRTLSYRQTAHVSEFIENLEGTLVNDTEIVPDELGDKDVSFQYVNVQGKIRTVNFNINIIDDIKPIIYGRLQYTVNVGYDEDLTNLILSGDELDDYPHREIIGSYNLNSAGTYYLEYKIADASGNEAIHTFLLSVVKPTTSSVDYQPEKVSFAEAVKTYKTDQTKVGIDVSSWQGEIDWPTVKSSGVEFAFIRIGYQIEHDGEYIMDKYFERNLNGASEAGLPIGVYFYSCANDVDEAETQAEWIISQLSDYDIELGIVFDWENWSDFNISNMSFRTLNHVANKFINTVEQHGYHGILYSSKNYLDHFWESSGKSIWLAQYYHEPTYAGQIDFWQLSSSGIVPGIKGDVDLDIMYLE